MSWTKTGQNLTSGAVFFLLVAAPLFSASVNPPANLRATATDTTITLSWTWSGNGGNFQIQRNLVTIAQPANTARTYTDSGLQPATAYAYRIRAVKGNNASSWVSISISTSTPPAPSCGETVTGPKTIIATTSNGVVSVSFLMDSNTLGTITASPFQWAWNTAVIPNGCHTLGAIARDSANQTGNAMPLEVKVQN